MAITERPTEVLISANEVQLAGTLVIPPDAVGVVLFAHGSGSSRFSPRNHDVAATMHEHHLGTLLFDLLTESEERIDAITARLRFDIPLLADRLVLATDWLIATGNDRGLPLGYFGASTGAAAALIASVERPDLVKAVVSRGGRPDLAGDALERVTTPTLLIVGARDEHVLELNQDAARVLGRHARIAVIPGATHLFTEPGTLDQAADLAAEWFFRCLTN